VNEPLTVNEMTRALYFLQKNGITWKHTYVHYAASPAFIYYTQIHPQKSKWGSLRDAHLLPWDTDYGKLAQENDTVALLITSISEEEEATIRQKITVFSLENIPYNQDGAIATTYKRKQ